jgi:pimeloyl-ACP methyl ester carboxylesterase
MAMATDRIETIDYRIPAGHAMLDGELSIPDGAKGLVVFCHGPAPFRRDPLQSSLAGGLAEAGFAVLRLDLLPGGGDSVRSPGASDIDGSVVSGRLVDATERLSWNRDTTTLNVGYICIGNGAAAALMAAADLPSLVEAVVSLGGRPRGAGDALPRVKAATLLIAGSLDEGILDSNRAALNAMTCEKSMEILHGMGNGFEEKGALAEPSRLAAAWFDRRLAA